MKKILLTAKIVESHADTMLVVFEGSPAYVLVSKKAVSKQSKTRRVKK